MKSKQARKPAIVEVVATKDHRNYDGIEMESLKREVDPPFNAMHDSLEECYYKHWKDGNSAPWFEWDVQPTPELSKELFDKLHGLLWDLHALKLHKRDQKRAAHLREARLAQPETQTELVGARARARAHRDRGIDLRKALNSISGFEIDIEE